MDSRPAGRRASLDILGCSTARLQGGAFLLRQHMHRSAAEILLPRVWAICFGMGMAWSWVAGWTAHWIALLAYCSWLGEICSPSGGDQSRHAQPSSSDPTGATRTPIDATVACSSMQCIGTCIVEDMSVHHKECLKKIEIVLHQKDEYYSKHVLFEDWSSV